MTDVGKNIRDARLAAGLTQDELAERVHVARQTVSNYETGFSRPDVDMLVLLSDALGVSIDALVRGGEEPKAAPGEGQRRPAPTVDRREALLLTAALSALAVLLPVYSALVPVVQRFQAATYRMEATALMVFWYRPLLCLLGGWTALQLFGTLFGLGRLNGKAARWVRRAALLCLGAYVLALLPYGIQTVRQLVTTLVDHRRTGYWYGSIPLSGLWERLCQIGVWVGSRLMYRHKTAAYLAFLLLGVLLWLSGGKKDPAEGAGKEDGHGEES